MCMLSNCLLNICVYIQKLVLTSVSVRKEEFHLQLAMADADSFLVKLLRRSDCQIFRSHLSLSVLGTFTSTWQKLESFGKWDPQLRNAPTTLAWGPVTHFLNQLFMWEEGPANSGLCQSWGRDPRVYKEAGWANLREQASKSHFYMASASALYVLALFGFLPWILSVIDCDREL